MTDNGIIDELIDPKVYQQMRDLDKGLDSNAQHMLKLVGDVEKLEMSLNKIASNKEFITILEEARKKTTALTSAQQELDKMQVQRQNIEQKNIAMRSKEAVELERVRQKQAEYRKELASYVKGAQAASGSLVEMRANLSELTRAYDNMSKAVRNSNAGRQAAKDIKLLSDELKKLEAETGRTGRNVGNYFESIKKGLLGIAGALGIATGLRLLVNVFKDGYKTIVDFEQANANLASVLGKTSAEIVTLTNDAKRLGEATEYSASQVTELQTELAKLGFNEDQIVDMTESILKFATAAGANLADAAALSGVALRAFRLESSETERVVSAMAAGMNKSALDFGYLQTAMSTIAPVANAFNFSIEDTVALLGTLANSGFDASSAATATRNILLNLADANGKLATELGRPTKSLDDLAAGLQELNAKGIDLATTLELTDRKSVAAFNTFLKGSESLTSLRDGVTNAGAALTQMQQTQLNTVQGATKLLQSAWEGLMLSFSGSTGVFKSVINILTGFVTVLTRLVNLFSEYSGVVKSVVVAFVAYVAAVKLSVLWTKNEAGALILSTTALKAKTAMMKLVTAATWLWSAAISLLTGNVKGATYAFQIFSQAIKASPIGLIAGAAALVTTALLSLRKEAKSTADIISDLDKATENYANGAGKINALAKEYETLKGKTERTKEENERLDVVMKQLAQSVPEAASQFDEYGKVLSINANKVRAFSSEQRQAIELDLKHQISMGQKRIKEIEKEIKEQQRVYQTGLKDSFLPGWGGIADEEDKGKAAAKANELYAEQIKLVETITEAEKRLKIITESSNDPDKSIDAIIPDPQTVAQRISDIQNLITSTKSKLKELRLLDASVNIQGIEEAEKSIKDLESELETLQGKKDKINKADEKAAKEREAIAARIAKANLDIYNTQSTDDANSFKRIADDEESSYNKRIIANKAYFDIRKEQITTNADYEANKTGVLAKEIEAIRAKMAIDLSDLDRQAADNRTKIAEVEVRNLLNAYKELADGRKNTLDANESVEVSKLGKKTIENAEKYEKAKTDIQKKYAKLRSQAEIDAVNEQIASYEMWLSTVRDSGEITAKEEAEAAKAIAALKINLIGLVAKAQIDANEAVADSTKSSFDKILEFFKDYADKIDVVMQAFETITNIGSEIAQRNIDKYNEEIDAINDRKDAEITAIEESAATDELKQQEKARVTARYAAQEAALEAKKRQEQQKQAAWEKAWAITQVGINTAQNIVKVFPNPALIALAAALGIAQAAMIASKPIPQYAEGTDDHPGGAAVVGDAGKREVVRTKQGRVFMTPSVPTVMNLPKHSEVFPDINSYRHAIMSQANESVGRAADLESQFLSAKDFENGINRLEKAYKSQKQASLHVSASSRNIWTIVRNNDSRRKSISKSLHV